MWEPKSISSGISTIGKDRLEILLWSPDDYLSEGSAIRSTGLPLMLCSGK
jgi:hypothetical protein